MYKLSRRSQDNLEGVDERLQTVVRTAIALTKIDFGVIQGLRTEAQQKELVARGASQTMKSKHLVGKAVDLMAYINGRASWEMNLYDDIADAMKEAANISSVQICWGAAWATLDMPYPMNIRKWKACEHTYYSKTNQAERTVAYPSTMEGAMNAYIDLRRSQERRPFMDGPHFELID